MKIITEDKLKIMSLDYATKNKIVNAKTIQAFIDGYKTADNHFSYKNMITLLINKFDKTDKFIENECQMSLAYSGTSITAKYKDGLLKKKELAGHLKTFLKEVEL